MSRRRFTAARRRRVRRFPSAAPPCAQIPIRDNDVSSFADMSKRSASKYGSGSADAKESQNSTFAGETNIVVELVPYADGKQTVLSTCSRLILIECHRSTMM